MFSRNLYAVIFILATAGLASCSSGKGQEKDSNARPVAVLLETPSSGSQDAILASGQVEAVQTTNISTRVMGRISNIYVKAGDKVSKGQLLATIGDEDIRAKSAQTDAMIDEAEVTYAAAQKDYDRFSKLYKQQSATAKELDIMTLQYNSAKARLDAAKQMRNEINASLSYCSLRAPFPGVITQKLAEVGSIANPGMPILTIEKSGILQVSAAIAESDINNIHLGDASIMQIKSTGKIFGGKIIQLNPSSQFTGGQYIVKINIVKADETGVYAGMFVSVSIPSKETNRVNSDIVLVPSAVIIKHDELTGVYTMSSQNTAMLRWIRLGKTYGDKVEVISGLSKDEQFIRSSESKLYNGCPVVLKEANKLPMATNSKL